MVDPGELRTPAVIDYAVETKNAHQEVETTWTTYVSRKVKIEALSGRELMAYEQVQGLTMHKATLRYASGVTCKMRLRIPHQSRTFGIAAVLPDDRSTWMTLHLTEAV